jgi:hypothetical protein
MRHTDPQNTFYHLGMKNAPGCAPIMACGVHLRSRDEGSWDNWEEWQLHQRSYGSAINSRNRGGEPRCPRCLESGYYGMCVLGDL